MSEKLIPEEVGSVQYGVRIVDGEDGQYWADGHVAERRFLAACNAHARKQLGLINAWDDRKVTADDFLLNISYRWAVPMSAEELQRNSYDFGFNYVPEGTVDALPVTVIAA